MKFKKLIIILLIPIVISSILSAMCGGCSTDHVIKEKKLTHQISMAYDHRQNLAERAIQTFKSHFISILNSRYIKYICENLLCHTYY